MPVVSIVAKMFVAVLLAEFATMIGMQGLALDLGAGPVEALMDGMVVGALVMLAYLGLRFNAAESHTRLVVKDWQNSVLLFLVVVGFESVLHPFSENVGRDHSDLDWPVINSLLLAMVTSLIAGWITVVDATVRRIHTDESVDTSRVIRGATVAGVLILAGSISAMAVLREANQSMFAREAAIGTDVAETISRLRGLNELTARQALMHLEVVEGTSFVSEFNRYVAQGKNAIPLARSYYERNRSAGDRKYLLSYIVSLEQAWKRQGTLTLAYMRSVSTERRQRALELQFAADEFWSLADRLISVVADIERQRLEIRGGLVSDILSGALAFFMCVGMLLPLSQLFNAQMRSSGVTFKRMQRVNSNLESYQRALDGHAIFAVTDVMGKILQVNGLFLKTCGYKCEEVVGQAHRILHSGVHDNAFYEDMWRTISNKGVWRGEICNRASDGTHYWVDSCITPLVGEDGVIERYVGISYDITQRRKAELMAERRQRLEKTIESMRAELLLQGSIYGMLPVVLSELNAITGAAASLVVELGRNRDGHAWGLMLGHARLAGMEDEGLPRTQPLLVNGADMHPLIQEAVQQSEAFGGLSARELGSNSFTAFEINVGYEPVGVLLISDLASNEGFDEYVKYVIGSLTDLMSARRESDRRRVDQENQRRLAKRDPLTGLGNRRELMEEFESRTDHPDATFAMMLIDLDRFKPINDTFGHLVGDTVLRVVSERLCAVAKGDCTVARIGGDEFAILTEAHVKADEAAAMDLAGKIIAELGQPIVCDGHELSVGASVGVAMYPRDGRSFQLVLHCADAAMYRAKVNRSEAQAFDASMDEAIRQRAELETELKRAIDEGHIVPHFQPYVDLTTGKVVGHEVLARWLHPTRGDVSPSVFVKIAEESGLVDRLFWLMLRTACKKHLDGNHDTILSVNLSPAQISNPLFANQLVDEIGRLKFSPHLLEIEITETSMVGDLDRVRPLLLLLKGFGVQIALDDFGTGYSSLALLRGLPISKLKIDHSFTSDLESQDSSRGTLVNAILGIAKAMSLKVTAEGIEHPEVAAYLREHGCDYGQGYLYAKALPEISCAIDTDARVPLRKRA